MLCICISVEDLIRPKSELCRGLNVKYELEVSSLFFWLSCDRSVDVASIVCWGTVFKLWLV